MSNNDATKDYIDFVLTPEGDFRYKFSAELKFDRLPNNEKGADICAVKMNTECGLFRSVAFCFSSWQDDMQEVRRMIEESKKMLFLAIRKDISLRIQVNKSIALAELAK